MTREKAIEYYRQYVAKKHDVIRRELRGKDLVCFCAPKPCHADVLLEIANDPDCNIRETQEHPEDGRETSS